MYQEGQIDEEKARKVMKRKKKEEKMEAIKKESVRIEEGKSEA